MSLKYKLYLIGCFTIGAFDALTAIASRQLNFNSAYFAVGSFIIYCFFGFWTTKKIDLKTGALTAAAIGFFDSTVGWKISMLLKANTGHFNNDPTVVAWMLTIIVVTAFAALCGLIGAAFAKYSTREKAGG
jgi:hypothetical protein